MIKENSGVSQAADHIAKAKVTWPNKCAKAKDKLYTNDTFATEYKFMLPNNKKRLSTGNNPVN